MIGDESLGMLAEWGRPITAKARTGLGILSHQTDIVVSGEIVYTGDSILAEVSVCGDLTHSDLINHDGVSYMVENDPFMGADGFLCRVPVTRMDPTEVPPVIIWGGGAVPTTGVIYSGGGA